MGGVNIGYGPMAVGSRWLAYASDNPLVLNTGRLSPQSLTPPLGVSPSSSPGSGSLVARYAMESSKQLATGLINLGDMGYKTLSRYCHDLMPDGSSSPVSSNSSWKVGRSATHSTDSDTAGMVSFWQAENWNFNYIMLSCDWKLKTSFHVLAYMFHSSDEIIGLSSILHLFLLYRCGFVIFRHTKYWRHVTESICQYSSVTQIFSLLIKCSIAGCCERFCFQSCDITI